MSDESRRTMNRQDVERVAHEALGRQLRLMVGLAALLLVLGFVVGQFTGAALARRNTERLQAQLEELEHTLGRFEGQLDERRNEQAELEEALSRLERLRRSEIETDRASLAALIDNAESARTSANTDLDEFDASRRTVPTAEVRSMVDRFVTEQVESMHRLLTSNVRRLGLPEQTKPSARVEHSSPRAPEPPAGSETDESESEMPSVDSNLPDPSVSKTQPAGSIGETSRESVVPPACRPRQETLVEAGQNSSPRALAERYLSPPRRAGYLFFAPAQPRRIDATRVSDSESIPLPPR